MALLTRRRFFGLSAGTVGAGLSGLAWMRIIEPRWLEINRRSVPVGHGLAPFKLLHLSDFHYSRFVSLKQINAAIEAGLALEPDAVCITGDFISKHEAEDEAYAQVLKRLGDAAPVFASPGNHDGGGWARPRGGYDTLAPLTHLLEAANIPLMINRNLPLEHRGATLRFVGLGDLWAQDLDPERGFTADIQPDEAVVVLSHNPDSKEFLKGMRWDLMLSGHTHGGQLRIPLDGSTPFAPVRDHRYVEGLHAWQGRHLHISKGVGNLYGMRLNCRPEITLLTLEG